jgi:hypothetical protein
MLIYARSPVKETSIPMLLPGDRAAARAAAWLLLLIPAMTPALGAADGARLLDDVVALAGRIGPRKTGTDADRRAVDYVRGQMEKAGLEVTLQEVARLEEPDGERAVGSWNVLGRLPGASQDTILVSAHHDTRGAGVPGANDDASGLAVLLETARLASARARRHTLLFASFCAEEEGLLGSLSFARQAGQPPPRAAIALELLGRGELVVAPAPKPPPAWAQRLLLRAARESGVTTAAARPIYTLVPRFLPLPFSADHATFLERGIPAFLLLGTFPDWAYHTQEDGVLGVRREALVRAATLLDRMLRDLDSLPPPEADDPHFLPIQAFGWGVVVPGLVLRGVALAGLAAAAILLLARLRLALSGRFLGETIRAILVTGACTALGLSGLFAAAALMQRIARRRLAWMAHPGLHVALGLVLMLVTSWMALKIFRRIKPTVDPGPYLGAALVLPCTGTALALRAGWPEIAALAAFPLLAFVASLFFEQIGRKAAIGLLGALPLLFLMSPGDARTAVTLGGIVIPGWVLFAALLAVLLPFVLFLAHLASFQDCLHSPFWWWLSGPAVGGVFLFLFLVLLGTTSALPAYDSAHRQLIHVRETVDLTEGRARAMLRSGDRLVGVRVSGPQVRTFDGTNAVERLELPAPDDRFGVDAVATRETPAAPENVTCRVRLRAPHATDRLAFVFTSHGGFRVPGRDESARHSYTFSESAPARDPERVFHLFLPPEGDLVLSVRADFTDDLLGLEPRGLPSQVFETQASIVATHRLLGSAAAPR